MEENKEKKEITTEYINLQTDFGFKRAFGSVKNKPVLIRLLNALFEGQLTVTDVVYHDKEKLPESQGGKRIVYDVYCTVPIKRNGSPYYPKEQTKGENSDKDADHHFILEMQNAYAPPFEERITYYAAKMVADQGKEGWEYTLDPVFAIAIIDFHFQNMAPKMVRDVMLVDRDSKEILTNKVHIMFCSLKDIPKKWEECETELARILFLIKNIDKMTSTSVAYRDGNFSEIFEVAKSNRLTQEETVSYSDSLQRLLDMKASIDFADEKAERRFEEGREVGREEGREEGIDIGTVREQKKRIRKMFSRGQSADEIAEIFDLTVEDVMRLVKES